MDCSEGLNVMSGVTRFAVDVLLIDVEIEKMSPEVEFVVQFPVDTDGSVVNPDSTRINSR